VQDRSSKLSKFLHKAQFGTGPFSFRELKRSAIYRLRNVCKFVVFRLRGKLFAMNILGAEAIWLSTQQLANVDTGKSQLRLWTNQLVHYYWMRTFRLARTQTRNCGTRSMYVRFALEWSFGSSSYCSIDEQFQQWDWPTVANLFFPREHDYIKTHEQTYPRMANPNKNHSTWKYWKTWGIFFNVTNNHNWENELAQQR